MNDALATCTAFWKKCHHFAYRIFMDYYNNVMTPEWPNYSFFPICSSEDFSCFGSFL